MKDDWAATLVGIVVILAALAAMGYGGYLMARCVLDWLGGPIGEGE